MAIPTHGRICASSDASPPNKETAKRMAMIAASREMSDEPNFLGFVPFETLQNKKQCSFCKCKWVG